MIERKTLSSIRFGLGLRPNETSASDVGALISGLRDARQPRKGDSLADRAKLLADLRDARRVARDGGMQDKRPEQQIRQLAMRDMRRILGNAVEGSGFAERLVLFWADHFTVAASNPQLRVLVPDFVQNAIRPHIGGRFSDMLQAVMTHPAMLHYLNQSNSVGPNSFAGKRRDRGLNENLAREVLELHTLGVDGAYSQEDVRNLALLLTGLSNDQNGFLFRKGIAEPGQQRILGTVYGGRPKTLNHVRDALIDISRHKDTARHIATKLVTHFVGAPAEPDLIGTVEAAFRNSDGNLLATYRALLSHDAAWQPELRKAKTPIEFIVSALRAGGETRGDIDAMTPKDMRKGVVGALREMGQTPFTPSGPDGWSEDPSAWITPPLLAARIRWATNYAERIAPNHDPRAFLEATLADAASEKLKFAVNGAESRVEGIVLTLVSPEFNRR